MQVAIIGTGSVGTALATGLADAGHDVVVGSRDPGATGVGDLRVATHQDAADFGAVVVLAVPADVVADVAAELAAELAGKPVVDPTNEYPGPRADRSVAVRLAEAVPDARVVKAFNTIGANLMSDPTVDGEQATMFLAGDDAAAVETVGTLASDLGFVPLVVVDLEAADHLEHLARFWIDLSQEYGREVAFRFLGASEP